jgi:mono/diheme cytochrome c family protein/glucose/arabinose dehydrogenase
MTGYKPQNIFLKTLICFSLFVLLVSCGTKPSEVGSISSDTTVIALGQAKFSQNCSACHNFREDGIGPQLGGLTDELPIDWIKKFIKDPKAVIESGDERAVRLFDLYKSQMPPFAFLTEEEIDGLVAFIHTKKAPPQSPRNKIDPNSVKNPIPEPIPMSDMVLELKEITQFPPSSDKPPLTRITKLSPHPNTNQLFVVDLRGKLYRLNENKPELYFDLAAIRPNFINTPGHATGFGSYAFHPEFNKNGLLYTSHSEKAGSAPADFAYNDSIVVTLQWVLTEWRTKTPNANTFSGESRELMRVNMVGQLHGMQEVTFNPLAKVGDKDYGLLYLGIGDGGNAERGFQFLCGNTEKIWGSVIRIDPRGKNSRNGKYGIPEDNPFVKSQNSETVKEIFAYGFRNPHRIIWTKAREVLVANVGHHHIESLYLVKPGSNCGWPTREGTFVINADQNMHNIYPLPTDDAGHNFTYPVAQYDHDEGNAIAGGFEYWGSAVPELKGKFIFGDIVKGRLFYIETANLQAGKLQPIKEWRVSVGGQIKTLSELCGADKVDERFGRDANGELYITTKPDGRMYQLVSRAK